MNMLIENLAKIILRFAIIAAVAALSGCSSSPLDFQTMLINLSKSYPAIWKLTTAAAYIIGFGFVSKAIYSLKVYGEARTMMSNSTSLKGPLTFLFTGTALIFSPQIFKDLLLSTFGTSQITPLLYGTPPPGWTQQSITALLGLVQVVGVIAFIRGWIYLARSGEQGAQQNTFGKGLTHIIGGILCINIVATRDVIWNTFGFGT